MLSLCLHPPSSLSKESTSDALFFIPIEEETQFSYSEKKVGGHLKHGRGVLSALPLPVLEGSASHFKLGESDEAGDKGETRPLRTGLGGSGLARAPPRE